MTWYQKHVNWTKRARGIVRMVCVVTGGHDGVYAWPFLRVYYFEQGPVTAVRSAARSFIVGRNSRADLGIALIYMYRMQQGERGSIKMALSLAQAQ